MTGKSNVIIELIGEVKSRSKKADKKQEADKKVMVKKKRVMFRVLPVFQV